MIFLSISKIIFFGAGERGARVSEFFNKESKSKKNFFFGGGGGEGGGGGARVSKSFSQRIQSKNKNCYSM